VQKPAGTGKILAGFIARDASTAISANQEPGGPYPGVSSEKGANKEKVKR